MQNLIKPYPFCYNALLGGGKSLTSLILKIVLYEKEF